MTGISPNLIPTPKPLLPTGRAPAFAFSVQALPNPRRIGRVLCIPGPGRKHARWRVPSLNRSLISTPGPTEAIKLDLSDGAGDQSFDVLRTEEEKSSTWEGDRRFPQDRGYRHLHGGNLSWRESSPSDMGRLGKGDWVGAGEAWALAHSGR